MAGLPLTQPYGVGCGVQEPFKIANPAAGATAAFQCDGRGLRRLLSLVFTLTTDANVAARYPTVEYVGGDGLAYSVAAVAATLAANGSQRYSLAIGYAGQAWNTGTDAFAPLPTLYLAPGDTLELLVASIQVGDQLSNIRGVMERFPLDGVGLPAPWYAEG